jgi:VWFA-related protein
MLSFYTSIQLAGCIASRCEKERQPMGKELWFSFAMCLTLGSYGQTAAPARNGTTVWVPALVESKSGKIVYGLSADDFSIKDDGIEQRISLETDSDLRPVSVLLVIQTGHNVAPQLGEIARLPGLLDSILTNPQDQVSIVTFDSTPHLVQDFTSSSETLSDALAAIAPGNAGAALFDAMHTAIGSFRRAAPGNHRVIILISGEHDHGSVGSNTGSLIRDVALSNTSIYSLSFRAGRKELLGKLRSLNPMAITGSAMEKNAGEALAHLTGGDFFRFDNERDFEDRIGEVATHVHNRYTLAFQSNSLRPGFHALQVEVRQSKVNIVAARSGYWVPTASTSASGDGSE